MKTFFIALFSLVAVSVVTAAPVLVGGSPLVVNNTSSNCAAATSFASPPAIQNFSVQHGALNSTNDITLSVSNTLDGVNYVYAYTWHPANTNATTEYINPFQFTNNLTRATVTTTNSQSVIINFGN